MLSNHHCSRCGFMCDCTENVGVCQTCSGCKQGDEEDPAYEGQTMPNAAEA